MTLAPASISASTEYLIDAMLPLTMYCLPIHVTLSLALTLTPASLSASTESLIDAMLPVTMYYLPLCYVILSLALTRAPASISVSIESLLVAMLPVTMYYLPIYVTCYNVLSSHSCYLISGIDTYSCLFKRLHRVSDRCHVTCYNVLSSHLCYLISGVDSCSCLYKRLHRVVVQLGCWVQSSRPILETRSEKHYQGIVYMQGVVGIINLRNRQKAYRRGWRLTEWRTMRMVIFKGQTQYTYR